MFSLTPDDSFAYPRLTTALGRASLSRFVTLVQLLVQENAGRFAQAINPVIPDAPRQSASKKNTIMFGINR
jgi:hypothetical protein